MQETEKILEGLNSQQRAAAESYEGPTLIVAGAGSGKTRTLTQRIAYMLACGVKPEEIMALTFTKKAAGEMKGRIMEAVGKECRPWKITMGTFHSVFIRLLSEFASRIGFQEKFTIYDEGDSSTLLRQIVKAKGLDDKKYKPSLLKSRISLAKNNLLTPQQYQQNKSFLDEDSALHIPEFSTVFMEYCATCRKNGAMDFDDILLNMHALLRDNPDVRRTLGERYRYILVDEYQDTNLAQYRILRHLTEMHKNICVVGDDSQSIYSFRGAKIENILRFRKDYSGASIFLLEQNYRSTKNIVNAANSLIGHNSRKLEKHLFSAAEDGEPIRIFSCNGDRNEAATIARDIKRRLLEDPTTDESNFAILYRNNFLSRLMEDELRSRNIPYLIYGGHSFYSRKEILDMIAYMKFCLNPLDDISLTRIINVPPRGIGETSMERLKTKAAAESASLWETMNRFDAAEMGIHGKAVKGLEAFKGLVNGLLNDENISCASDFAKELIERSRILQSLRETKLLEDEERAGNIESLLSAVVEWEIQTAGNPETEDIMSLPAAEQLQQWLTDIALLTDMDEKADDKPRVTLMTVHASKGLEFNCVYIIGVEENIFPSARSAGNPDSLEEERRIFYVAITRAKKYAALSWSNERFMYGSKTEYCKMSRFISEIDPQYLTGLSERKRQPWDDDTPARPWKPASVQTVRKPSPNSSRTVYRKDDVKEIEESNGLRAGVRVEHRIFGKGKVKKLALREGAVKVTIQFDTEGERTLIEKFGNIKKI